MDQRIDYYPTHEHKGVEFRRGLPYPFGASMVPNGINFSIFSSAATSCTLVLFDKGEIKPFIEIEIPQEFKIGDVYSIIVFDLDYENLEYGYRMDGPFEPESGHRFDKNIILADPYAKALGGLDEWLQPIEDSATYPPRSRLAFQDFDWEGDASPLIPIEALIIYEMHVRSFTKHPSSGVKFPGTFAGIAEKIAYLKELGINCVELMPVFEFSEYENSRTSPESGELLVNYWGYSTLGFFAPKAGYAAMGKYGMQVDEFKNLIKILHANGIEVILDVVFNHTSEGDHRGLTLHFKGIDNKTYYMLTPEGYYFNFSGCGNTLNCNHPVVRNMVLDCLRYWVSEYHIDGFRFDLAAILGRDQEGNALSNPPLLESLAYDPILSKCKLIAEAWDAGGLYQVGSFPAYGRWTEWNGKFRDSVRRFLRSDSNMLVKISQRIQGSPDLYFFRGPTASVNFITCHDGFTLWDVFSYNEKHNLANGEYNMDGENENYSWNCGEEGHTDDLEIIRLRKRQVKNAFTILMCSQGVPMILMGDEICRTKLGNNNTYCHDNELNWLNWNLLNKNADIYRFAKKIIEFRKQHNALRSRTHFQNRDYVGSGYPDISFHGEKAWDCDWSANSRIFALMLCGKHASGGMKEDDYVYVAMNMYWETLEFEVPALPENMKWRVAVNTDMQSPDDIFDYGKEPILEDQSKILIGSRSIIVLAGRK